MNDAAEKQEPHYASFNMRFFASMVDVALVGLCLTPVFGLFEGGFREKYRVNEFLQKLEVQLNTPGVLPEEIWITVHDFFVVQGFLWVWLFNSLLQFAILGILVFLLWRKYDATPGKMLLRMKIVDEKTLGTPSRRQYIIRYLAYAVSILPLMFGFVAIAWDKKRQGWHDKLASTVVIKAPKKSA